MKVHPRAPGFSGEVPRLFALRTSAHRRLLCRPRAQSKGTSLNCYIEVGARLWGWSLWAASADVEGTRRTCVDLVVSAKRLLGKLAGMPCAMASHGNRSWVPYLNSTIFKLISVN